MTRVPHHLRVEHLDEPFGIGVPTPRLSWQLPPLAARQHAYRLQAGRWDSGWVESPESVLVAYAGPALQSRDRIAWRVQVRSDLGTSAWSDWAHWEMGLLAPNDWVAAWITPLESHESKPPGERPAYLLRTNFEVERAVTIGRAYATARGLYELFVNGERLGDDELTPGFTSYRAHLHVQTFDITSLLRQGDNELRVVLSDGWYRGQVGYTREHDVYGSETASLVQVEVDGSPVAATGTGWQSALGSIVHADLIAGQHVDQRVAEEELRWEPAVTVEHDMTSLCASQAPPVRRVETIRPRSVTELRPMVHVVDLGQNINGWVRVDDVGPRDTRLTLTHGESLDPTGDVTMDHLAPDDWTSGEPLDAGQVDVVVSDGARRPFEPRHTTHGFRYVRVEGHPGPLAQDDVTGIVVHTDLPRTGWFRCSDERLNQLHEAAVWSFRTNACDIPTDCPQRERAGWTGDWQIFAPTAAFLYDVAGFSTKWLRDLAADQRADGVVRNFAPDPAPAGADENAIKTFIEGSSGWGDAAVLVPWAMWRAYGDRRLLEEQWPSMMAWVDFETGAARAGRHPLRIERSTEPRAHEEFLWDTGFHWGEWCEPDLEDMDHFANFARHDFGIIATAYFAHSAAILAAIARVLEQPEDADRYDVLARNVREAWQTEFVTTDGAIRSTRQADYVRALAFNLIPTDQRNDTARRLVELILAAGTHLNTGFLATPHLLPVLADAGHLDLAYELLLQDTPPSWLTMIDRGATTIWEHWEGVDADGVAHASLNHYSKGAVVSFLHQYVAGIRVLDDGPGYRRFEVAPKPGGDLTWAEAAHESPYGRIESSWWTGTAGTSLIVQVPPNTEAVVSLPDGAETRVGPGRSSFRFSVA